jgi:anthranilate synthase component 1
MPTVASGLPPLSPSREEFRTLAGDGNLVPVHAELTADVDTAPSAFQKLDSSPYGFLLESVGGSDGRGRYSFLATDPETVVTVRGARVSLRHAGGHTELLPSGSPFEVLRELLSPFTPVPAPGLPPFQGGAVVFVGYDMIRHVERAPDVAADDLRLPDAVFMLTDRLLVFDRHRHRLIVIANARVDERDAASLDRAYDAASARIEALLASLRKPPRVPAALPIPALDPLAALGEDGFTSTLDESAYADAVRRAKEHISARDLSGIVVSRRLDTDLRADPFIVYRALRAIDPSPYCFFLRLGKSSILGAAPEGLVRFAGGRVEASAGGEARGVPDAPDGARVEPAPGTSGDALHVLEAALPAGAVTGAPTVRAMELIEELEPARRGPYGGAVGYVSYSGNLDSCIADRTVLCHGRRASIQVGAAIAADSDPKTEWLETCSKARGPILALRIAGQESA